MHLFVTFAAELAVFACLLVDMGRYRHLTRGSLAIALTGSISVILRCNTFF